MTINQEEKRLNEIMKSYVFVVAEDFLFKYPNCKLEIGSVIQIIEDALNQRTALVPLDTLLFCLKDLRIISFGEWSDLKLAISNYIKKYLETQQNIAHFQATKKEHNTNDMCKSEAKQKIEMIKQGKLPPIPSVDNQSTKGLVTSDTYDSEAKRIIKCVEEGKLPPIFDEEHK